MPLYEHTFLTRHSLTSQQATTLTEEFAVVLTENGGSLIDSEYWGLRSLAYRIRNSRKAHYSFMRTEAPASAVQEMERRMRLSEDVIRVLTVRVDKHEEGPSAMIRAKAGRDSRRSSRRDGEDGEERRRPIEPREPRKGASSGTVESDSREHRKEKSENVAPARSEGVAQK